MKNICNYIEIGLNKYKNDFQFEKIRERFSATKRVSMLRIFQEYVSRCNDSSVGRLRISDIYSKIFFPPRNVFARAS